MALLSFLYLVVLGFLALNVLYLTVLAVAGKLGRTDDRFPDPAADALLRRIGVLIPAYKEDAVIESSVRFNGQQDYPADRYDLIVIADSFQPETLARLAQLPVRVMDVSFEVSSVAKALHTAIGRIPAGQYDLLVVADADNHLAPDFLRRINTAFGQGWLAVQGHRVAKNTDTSVAILDSVSEEINNHLFRKGTRALGLSASIIGSGMGIETERMRTSMNDLHTMGGYDKELEMRLVLAGNRIGYLADAYVYDEKVSQRAVFETQRTRWVAAQWQFLTRYIGQSLSGRGVGRWHGFFMIVKALVLPKILLLGVLTGCCVLSLLVTDPLMRVLPPVLLLTLGLSLLLSVPIWLRHQITLREWRLLPAMLWSMVRAIWNMRRAFRRFLPTPHTRQ